MGLSALPSIPCCASESEQGWKSSCHEQKAKNNTQHWGDVEINVRDQGSEGASEESGEQKKWETDKKEFYQEVN